MGETSLGGGGGGGGHCTHYDKAFPSHYCINKCAAVFKVQGSSCKVHQ